MTAIERPLDDPARRGSHDLYKLGPMEMTPGRSAIIEAALERAKPRTVSHACRDCGDETVPAGTCRICRSCGSSTGCS